MDGSGTQRLAIPDGQGLLFREIHDAYRRPILRYLARLVGEGEAEDVAQEVFLRIGRGLEDFRGDGAVGTWIYRIARNAAYDRLRRRTQRNGSACELDACGSGECTEGQCPGFPDEEASVERKLIEEEMRVCIRGRVGRLPESYRRVLEMSEWGGMSNAEIASALGTTEGAVKIRLHRARGRLREDLDANCAVYRDDRDEWTCDPKPAPPRTLPVSFSGSSSSVETKTGR